MIKGQHSALFLLLLLLLFLAVIFLIKKPEAQTTETTTTTVPATTTTLPLPEITTTTTLLPSKCTGTNIYICGLGTKYQCSTYNCCYWDQNISRCKPKTCSEIEEEFCASCGCTLSQ